jgi:hypothetical protein
MVIIMVSEPQAEALRCWRPITGRDHVPPRAEEARRSRVCRNLRPAAALRVHLEPHHTARHPDRSLDHLSAASLPPANNLELVDWVAERFRDEVLLHLEFSAGSAK